MLKYPCLVLDHDDTVVQSMKTLSYPFFCYILDKMRPGQKMDMESYIFNCHNMGFMELCRHFFGFTDEELAYEHEQWMGYIRTHIPDPYPGIQQILRKHKAAGGTLCVVSHSGIENITRDYLTHFGFLPDAIYGWDLPPEKRKPNTFPLEDIMERYDFKSGDILVVDDMKLSCMMAKPLNVKVAYAGWSGMGVPSIDAEMNALCDLSFSSVEALEAYLFDEDTAV